MALKLRDAVVVVTGASSGIGRATTELLAESGATVVAVARREDRSIPRCSSTRRTTRATA